MTMGTGEIPAASTDVYLQGLAAVPMLTERLDCWVASAELDDEFSSITAPLDTFEAGMVVCCLVKSGTRVPASRAGEGKRGEG